MTDIRLSVYIYCRQCQMVQFKKLVILQFWLVLLYITFTVSYEFRAI